MNKQSLAKNIFSLFPVLHHTINDMTQSIEDISLDDLLVSKSSNMTGLALQFLKSKQIDPNNAIIQIGNGPSEFVFDVTNNQNKITSIIKEKLKNNLTDLIYSKYADKLKEDESIGSKFKDSNFESSIEFIEDVIKEKINELLYDISSLMHVTFLLEELRIIKNKKRKILKMGLKMELNPIKPFIKLSLSTTILKQQLIKIVFQVDGFIEMKDIELEMINKSIVMTNHGSMHAELQVMLQKIEILNDIEFHSNKETIRELVHKEISKKIIL